MAWIQGFGLKVQGPLNDTHNDNLNDTPSLAMSHRAHTRRLGACLGLGDAALRAFSSTNVALRLGQARAEESALRKQAEAGL